MVWLKVYRAYLHIWGEVLFGAIGNRFSVTMCVAEATLRLDNFEVGMVQILFSGEGRWPERS